MIKVELLDHMGSDLAVVNAARVSFAKESEWVKQLGSSCEDYCPDHCNETCAKSLSEKDTKLIHYLAKHKHTSPFNHCFASFRVKAPIFVARQLVKHEYLPWNEVSRRYVDDTPEFYLPEEWHAKADNKKQGSSDDVVKNISHSVEIFYQQAEDLYNWMLSVGVAPEEARMVLPLSTMTEWIWSGSLGAFAKMASLRLSSDSQRASREVATLVADHMSNLFPVAWKALLEVSYD